MNHSNRICHRVDGCLSFTIYNYCVFSIDIFNSGRAKCIFCNNKLARIGFVSIYKRFTCCLANNFRLLFNFRKESNRYYFCDAFFYKIEKNCWGRRIQLNTISLFDFIFSMNTNWWMPQRIAFSFHSSFCHLLIDTLILTNIIFGKEIFVSCFFLPHFSNHMGINFDLYLQHVAHYSQYL